MSPTKLLFALSLVSSPLWAIQPFGSPSSPAAGGVLPVEQAFVFKGVKREGKELVVRWEITPGYYLYRHMLKTSVDAPSGASLGAPLLPTGEKKHDEEFGDVETYRGALTARYPLPARGPQPKTLRVKYQGCADVGLCYPPQTQIVVVK